MTDDYESRLGANRPLVGGPRDVTPRSREWVGNGTSLSRLYCEMFYR